MNNLIADGSLNEVKEKLSDELDRWMKSQGDPGKPEDTLRVYEAARKGKHVFAPPAE